MFFQNTLSRFWKLLLKEAEKLKIWKIVFSKIENINQAVFIHDPYYQGFRKKVQASDGWDFDQRRKEGRKEGRRRNNNNTPTPQKNKTKQNKTRQDKTKEIKKERKINN